MTGAVGFGGGDRRPEPAPLLSDVENSPSILIGVVRADIGRGCNKNKARRDCEDGVMTRKRQTLHLNTLARTNQQRHTLGVGRRPPTGDAPGTSRRAVGGTGGAVSSQNDPSLLPFSPLRGGGSTTSPSARGGGGPSGGGGTGDVCAAGGVGFRGAGDGRFGVSVTGKKIAWRLE